MWVECIEKMPPLYQFVIVLALRAGTDEPYSYGLGRWDGDEWELVGDDNEAGNGCYGDLLWGMDHFEITHWMKLPELPLTVERNLKKEEDNDLKDLERITIHDEMDLNAL